DALAGLVIVLIAVPVGGAIVLALIHGDTPCILCWAQRTSMILIALVGLFVVRYGPRPRYLGLAVLLGAWGVFMSLRHSGLHLARDVGQGFAAPILGVHTYAWAWLVHWIVLLAIGVLFFFLREGDEEGWPRQPGGAFRFAVGLFVVVVAANAVQAFVTTGPPPFIGQGDPVRFALNPRHWVWSLEELSGSISLRGSWTVPPPDVAAVDPEPDHGPLADLPELDASAWERIDLPDGSLTGLAHDPVSGDFLAVTDRYDVYLLDETLARLVHGVTLDPSFSIDLSPLAGAAFLGDTLAVVSTNKSYALLRANGPVDEKREWRRFRVMDPEVSELSLGRFATVRARQMFVMSLAYDAAAEELITVAVPSPRHERLVVSRFARGDLILASEFEPRLAPGLTLSGEDRSLAEYVVSGAVAADGLLYALSAAYST
ncbi:MAG: disulfide bond formation protein B, partial [Gemmatimonadetes bacterium]|nr:disulfide bond formation protein B [Gemmatimonadota bacterium]NIR89559.1 disulfide bond formation protein B [Gammaproteobacteria bacterium]NIT68611.1 disulfide bond formation protein B [Gemmatimonadota bacterium]NIU52871.1 disulfide bond formation protein B [Gemmatimonadota bacterium]NIW36669.1 disulfide bond formation protein B [Gemmatimonadota bacterium]